MADTVSPDQRLAILGSLADALPDPSLLLDRRSLVLHRNPAAQIEPEAEDVSVLGRVAHLER